MSYKGNDRYDISVRTGDLDFAPTWEMVMGIKNHTMSEKEYTKYYLGILKISNRRAHNKWVDILNRDEITFVCYCKKGSKFCHRYILGKIFGRIKDVQYMGER